MYLFQDGSFTYISKYNKEYICCRHQRYVSYILEHIIVELVNVKNTTFFGNMIEFLKLHCCVLFNKDRSENYRLYIVTDQIKK